MTAQITRCQAGEADAIQELVKDHQAAVFRLALSILDDAAEADEATQDVFLRRLAEPGILPGQFELLDLVVPHRGAMYAAAA